MRLQIHFLRQSHALCRAFKDDGWHIDGDPATDAYATHPDARDEPALRNRLARLGMLTSRLVRIEFERRPPPDDAINGRADRRAIATNPAER
jgi:hypothetical protein